MKDSQLGTGRLLAVSAATAFAFAVVALVVGVVADSQMIVFDGLFSFISVLLTGVSIAAYRAVRKGPSERYPYGRPGLEPLAIMVKGSALGVLCLYALTGAIGELANGGREVSSGLGLIYAGSSTVVCAAAAWYLRSRADSNQLAAAESSEWLMDGLLSAAVTAGFVLAVILDGNGRSDLARLVDPGMVALASLAFLPVPARLFVRAWRELLGSAPEELDRDLKELASAIATRHGFAESVVRTTKTGPQLDLLVSFVVDRDADPIDVAQIDAIRSELADALESTGLDVWLDVTLTVDRDWVA